MDLLESQRARVRALRTRISSMGEKGEDASFLSRVTPRPAVAPLRNRLVLPVVGDEVVVCDDHTGRPRRPGVFRVVARQGGVPRLGRDGKPRPPALVEYLVEGFGSWHPWHQLERVTA